jgi:protein involved in polysaccharide export with SLBB domain
MSKLRILAGQWVAVCGLLLVGGLLAGCQSARKDAVKDAAKDPAFADVSEINAPAAPVATGAAAEPAAAAAATQPEEDQSIDVIKVGEKLTITLLDIPTPLPALEEQVRNDGTITLIESQTFQAAGKNRGDLEKEIRERYVPRIFQKMTVNIQHTVSTRFYSVGGEVKAPGRQVYINRLRLLDAIQSAGDFTDFARRGKVQLTRANGQIHYIDCIDALKDPKLNVEIYPGDNIRVERKKPWQR